MAAHGNQAHGVHEGMFHRRQRRNPYTLDCAFCSIFMR